MRTGTCWSRRWPARASCARRWRRSAAPIRKSATSPSYEIVIGPQAGGRFFAPNLRQVTPEGVAHVQAIFRRHYCVAETDGGTRAADAAPPTAAPPPAPPDPLRPPAAATAALPSAPGHDAHADRYAALAAVICDEEAIVHAPAGGA